MPFHARKIIMNLSPTCPAWSSHGHVGKGEIAVTFFSCPTMSLAHKYIRHNLKSSLKNVSNDRLTLRACLVSNAYIPTALWTDFQWRSARSSTWPLIVYVLARCRRSGITWLKDHCYVGYMTTDVLILLITKQLVGPAKCLYSIHACLHSFVKVVWLSSYLSWYHYRDSHYLGKGVRWDAKAFWDWHLNPWNIVSDEYRCYIYLMCTINALYNNAKSEM